MRHFLLLLAFAVSASAQETMIREVFDTKTDTHVEVLALFTQPSHGGFLPVRVKVANNLKNDHTIHLNFISQNGYGQGVSCKSEFSFTATGGKALTQDIMVPTISCPTPYGDQMEVTASLSGSLGNATGVARAGTSSNTPAVLLSESLFTPNASTLDAEIRSKSGSSYGGGEFAGKFDPKQLPSDWLAFSGYDSVLMTDSDWSNVPTSDRNAILSWMNLGGQLVIYATGSSTNATLGIPADTGYGSLLIKTIGSDRKLDPPETIALVSGKNPVSPRASSIRSDYEGGWPLQSRYGAQAFHYGLFIAVLIVFGILVGPINLFVFAKSGQRHRLFITTPLISLGASLVLIALIIFQDGFGGSGMRRVLMEVRSDAGTNAAFINQEQFSRTGILTASRFTVDPECFFAPVPISKSRWARYTTDYNTRGNFNILPSGGKMQVSGDWWQSRSEHGHALSAVIPTRGRIEHTAEPNVFVSTFDFPIEKIYFLDEAKEWHWAENIATGKPFTLTSVNAGVVEPELANEANDFAARNRQILNRAKNRPGHFIALTRQAPGIDTYPGIRWKETRTVITGPVVTR